MQDTAQDLQRSSFARAVGTDKADYLARFQRERNLLDGSNLAVRAPEQRTQRGPQPCFSYRRSVNHAKILDFNDRNHRFLLLMGLSIVMSLIHCSVHACATAPAGQAIFMSSKLTVQH